MACTKKTSAESLRMPERRLIRPAALQRLKDTYRNGDVLLPELQRHVMRSSGAPRPDDHSMQYMHPSDMVKPDWCGRHDYYRIVGTKVEKTSAANPSFRMENIWAQGTAIHGKYQTWLWEMGVLFGDWECLECGHRYGALSPTKCQFCLSERLIYRELPMRRNQYLIEGHADGAVHADWLRALIEIKSIGINSFRFDAPRLWNRYQDGESADDLWFSIKRPFATHVRQGQLYLWLSWPAYEQIVFIYESKFNQQTKEFVVGYNKNLIAPLLEVAREVSQGVRAGIEPDRPLWAEGPDGKVCTSCEYRKTCWGIHDRTTQADHQEAAVRILRAKPARRRRALRTP